MWQSYDLLLVIYALSLLNNQNKAHLTVTVAVLFGSHAGNSFEIAVKRCRFREAEQVGCLLKCLRGTCRNEPLGLCYHILLYPFGRRETVGSHTNDLAEVLGREVQPIGVELNLPRLPIVPYHQLAEVVEDLHMPVCLPLLVLFVTIVIEEFIAYGQLCQQCLIAVGHFLVGMGGDDAELVYDGQQMTGLLVCQRADGSVVEFRTVVAEGVIAQVVEQSRRDCQHGIGACRHSSRWGCDKPHIPISYGRTYNHKLCFTMSR